MKYLLIALISYLIGNISFSILIGKLFFKKDVRDYGSGNAGATNAIRAFGAKFGVLTFLGDMLKGALAAYIGNRFGNEIGGYIAGISVIVGHNWPVFLGFKGGKGVSTTIGVVLVIMPIVSIICFVIGITIAVITRMVSLGSIIGMTLGPIVVLLTVKPFNVNLFIFTLIVCSMCIFKHRNNIKRLLAGQENKL